jgi:hypothetical protein
MLRTDFVPLTKKRRRRHMTTALIVCLWLASGSVEGFSAKLSASGSRQTATVSEQPQIPRPKIDRHWRRWNLMTQKLSNFYQTHGHSFVTTENCDNDLKFFRWTVSIRKNYRYQLRSNETRDDEIIINPKDRPFLPPSKIHQLQTLHFVWDAQSHLWDMKYRLLCDFHAEHGHCRVPATHPHSLGGWVRNQRREYNKLLHSRPSTLTQTRLERLEALGFVWFKSRKEAWDEQYSALVNFYNLHGHSNVPQQHAILGDWCMNQRTYYRREDAWLTPERIALLEKLDFSWTYWNDFWYKMCARLHEFAVENGHIRISGRDKLNKDLRAWLNTQRFLFYKMDRDQREYRKTKKRLPPMSRLTRARIEALQAIPNFTWSAGKGKGPTRKDWGRLLNAMRDIGITPDSPRKTHWFEGINPLTNKVKTRWTDNELLQLWNQGDDVEVDDENFKVDADDFDDKVSITA